MENYPKFCLIHYREDVTGISEGIIVAGMFDTLTEANDYFEKNIQNLQSNNPYFVHLAKQEKDGHYYLLADEQIIYL